MLSLFIYAGWRNGHPSTSGSGEPQRVVDSFGRSVVGSWGASSLGAWRYELTAGSPFQLDVRDGMAEAHSPVGENKANLLVGPVLPGPMDVRAAFSVDYQPAGGTPNHWQVILRHQGMRDYYAAELLPSQRGSATVSIFAAKGGVFTELGRAPVSFTPVAGQAYVIEGRVWDEKDGVHLAARAWPRFEQRPSGWQVFVVDRARDGLAEGQVGVRLSMYAGPVTARVDDFSVARG
jgi:hypothetical protein